MRWKNTWRDFVGCRLDVLFLLFFRILFGRSLSTGIYRICLCFAMAREARRHTATPEAHYWKTDSENIHCCLMVNWWWAFFLCAQYDLQIARYHIMLANGYFLRIHRKICYQRAKHKYMLFTCDFSISSNTFSHPRELECHPISEASPRISEWKPSVKKQ